MLCTTSVDNQLYKLKKRKLYMKLNRFCQTILTEIKKELEKMYLNF